MSYIGYYEDCCSNDGGGNSGTMSNRYDIVEQSSSFVAEKYKFYSVDATNNAISVTLPTDILNGDWVGFIDKLGKFSINNFTVLNGGSTIRNNNGNFIADLDNVAFKLVYNNGNWNLFDMSVAIVGGDEGSPGSPGVSSGYSIISVSSNLTAVSFKYYLISATSSLTITLPSSPSNGDWFILSDKNGNFGTYNITVSGTSSVLNNADGIKLDLNNTKVKFVYYNGNWDVLNFS